MKEVIKGLSKDRTHHTFTNISTFEKTPFDLNDLKGYVDALLTSLNEVNPEIDRLVEMYYQDNNEREFNKEIREYAFKCERKGKFQDYLRSLALKIACEEALNQKIKRFVPQIENGVDLSKSNFG